MAGLEWRTPPIEAWPKGAEAYVRAVRAGIHGVCQRWAPEIENWMKQNAVWTDRTSNARQGLYAQVNPESPAEVISLIEVAIAHGVDYGAYLEGYDPRHGYARTGLGNRVAIIEPALDRFGPLIWRDIRGLFQ